MLSFVGPLQLLKIPMGTQKLPNWQKMPNLVTMTDKEEKVESKYLKQGLLLKGRAQLS
jgi:hypothetical protein